MNKINFLLFVLMSISIAGFSQEKLSDTIVWTLDLDDVVVTAQYAPTDSRSAVHKIRTISNATIQQRGVTNLEQLLSQELNIRVSQDMILGSSINLQGVSGQNVQIMIDGVPIIGRVGGDIDLGQVNLANIERVEIIEGPLSVNFGTNALGGVINLITKKTQIHKFNTQINALWEDVGRQNKSFSFGIRPDTDILVKFQAGYNKFNGFSPPSDDDKDKNQRSTLWNPKEQKMGGFSVRYNLGKDQRLQYSAKWFNENITNLGKVRRPQYKPYAFDDYYQTLRQDFSLHQEGSIGSNFYLKTTLGYNYFQRKKNTFRFNFNTEEKLELLNQQDTTRFKAFIFRPVLASKNQDWKINFQVGLDFHYENGFGKRINDPDSDKPNFSDLKDYAIFGSLQYEAFDDFILQLGTRAAKNTRFNAPLIPSVNIKYSFDKLTLRGSYAKGFRSPSLKELFFYFVDASHFILGNPDLKAETSNNYQVAADWKSQLKKHRIEASVTAFYNHIQQKIDLYEYVIVNGQLVPAAEVGQSSGKYAYFNQEQYKTTGGNLRLKYGFGNFDVKLGFSPIGRYNRLSESVDDISPFSFVYESNGEISYRFPKQNFRIALYMRHNDQLIRYYQTYDDDDNLVTRQFSQDGFTIADFTTSKYFWKKRIQFKGGAHNVFDIKNVPFDGGSSGAHTGGRSGSIPTSMGRIWFAGLSWNFGWK